MIPFDMVRLDSNIAAAGGEVKKPVMDRIIDVGKVKYVVTDQMKSTKIQLQKFVGGHGQRMAE